MESVNYDVNEVTCESTTEWRPPGFGLKSICHREGVRKKATVSVKFSQPCPLYTDLQKSNCRKYEELISTEKEGRLRVLRLFENFNINQNIAICQCTPEAATNAPVQEKINSRSSAFLAAVDKNCEWISYAAKEYPTTTKARKITSKMNRLVSANSPCKVSGCQCCSVMAQSNICVDNDGSRSFRAEVNKEVNCRSSNVVYVIRCRRSGKNIHIGQTKQELHDCLIEHRTRQSSVVYQHFTSEGFSFDDMEVMILADIDNDEERKEREEEWKKRLGNAGRKHQRKQ